MVARPRRLVGAEEGAEGDRELRRMRRRENLRFESRRELCLHPHELVVDFLKEDVAIGLEALGVKFSFPSLPEKREVICAENIICRR